MTNAPGRFLVGIYYRLSPSLARGIAANEPLRAATRGVLWPVVWWTRLALFSPALAFALGGGGLVAGPIIPLFLLRSRRFRATSRTRGTKP